MDKKMILEVYGFSDSQIDKLLKTKKLLTVHGEYKIIKDKLYLNEVFKMEV